jgi:hypothetical protein
MMIGTDCIGSCKSSYHATRATSILKVKIFESEFYYELKYVIEIYHIIYILFICLNCMLL